MQGWGRLGRRIVAERSRRWRTRREFAHATGLSVRVLADLERGSRANFTDSTLAAVEAALGWSPGTCRRIVTGGRVSRELEPALVRIMDVWPRLSPDAKVILAEMAERAVER